MSTGSGERRSWIARTWWWSVPLGCLGLMVLCLGSCSLLCAGKFWGAKRQVDEALVLANHNPAAIEALGEPIVASPFGEGGDTRFTNDDGVWRVRVPVRGPKGRANLRFEQGSGDGSKVRSAELVVEGSGEVIALIPPEDSDPSKP
ncbi:MAG: cytochrome c oxidase assembly factor Coa1 family protein [Acidobacteriota bacterium]